MTVILKKWILRTTHVKLKKKQRIFFKLIKSFLSILDTIYRIKNTEKRFHL